MKKLSIVFSLLLAGCVATPAPIVTVSCNPPSSIMVLEQPVPPIKETTLTEQQILQYWLTDDQRLNSVILDKNALINHINKFCKAK